ncbi:hypothetical protein [Mangrovimonas cancribranchiae]|uniref:Uncharacterized protein n=1 Tax=Mangrovimonas cancribranchiae TaxID=3080055 RepID=A0AAU6P6E7_9FLAO
MIIATRENIYGLDVFSFTSSRHTPYQLIFDDNINSKHTEVSLVNLLGQNDAKYCREIRKAVSSIIFNYLVDKNCTLYFDFKLDKKGVSLLKKFIRWIKLERRIKTEAEITPFKNSHYIEFKLKLDKEYLKSLKVN